MQLKIKTIKEIPSESHVVYTIGKGTSLKHTCLTKEEIKYAEQQLSDEKITTLYFNKLSHHVWLVVLNTENDKLESARKLGADLKTQVLKYKIVDISVHAHKLAAKPVMAFVEGFALSSYTFDKYFTENLKEKKRIEKITVCSDAIKSSDVEALSNVVDAVFTARDLVNEPQNVLTAEELANAFKKLGKDAGFDVEVLNKAKIETLKMGGILAVNKGSLNPPTFTIMEYKPKKALNKKPIILVGKGVVYDTGGLSLKPTAGSMDSMKCDMAGAATVGCIMYAIAKNELPFHVIALVPATDNRPSHNAYAPGDVITMFSGLTVEVLNTDAEGRLILADALHYAKKYDPELVIDFATLTGAAVAAIGTHGSVCMGTANEQIKTDLKKAGFETHERLAEMPLWDEYGDMIKSDIADIKNIGGKYAGAITAGKFLEKFIDYPWMHIDIAGPSFLDSPESYRGKNGTGVGVRLIYRYLLNRLEAERAF